MFISSLSLTNYRSYNQFSISFSEKGNVFYGRNGIGKTNLLEAICYLAYGKSYKVNSDLDLINHNKDFFRIEGSFFYQNKTHTFDAALDRKGRKRINIDDRRIEKISELYRMLKVIFFSQEDINLISGTPKQRRHFFDLAISQYNYHYLEQLRNYNQTVKQRNMLLKSSFNPREKAVWDKQLVETATAVIECRNEYLRKINQELQLSSGSELGIDTEHVKIKYVSSFNKRGDKSLIDQFTQELKKCEKDEYHYQRTLIGPHLDDYRFMLNDRLISRFGSHGQKRCFVIVLGLAQSRLVSKTDNDAAIMIFDDVLSDLDSSRTTAILSSISGNNQIFIATPNPSPYKDLHLPLIAMEEILSR